MSRNKKRDLFNLLLRAAGERDFDVTERIMKADCYPRFRAAGERDFDVTELSIEIEEAMEAGSGRAGF